MKKIVAAMVAIATLALVSAASLGFAGTRDDKPRPGQSKALPRVPKRTRL